jgi:hypothetical protein
MVSFTELVLLAGDKVGRKLSDVEEAKVFFKQVSVDSKKTKVEKEFKEGERKRWFTRKALNNWLSRLKNQYRPQKYKKNVKVKVEGALAEDNDGLDESSDGEESGDSEEEASTFKEGGAPQEEDGDAKEDDNASQEEGGASEEEGGASEEEEGAVEEEGSDQEEDPTNKDGNEEQSDIEDVADNSSDDSD